jgi:hypothetical protein
VWGACIEQGEIASDLAPSIPAPPIYAYLENAAARYVALNVHVLRWVKRL